MDIKTITAKVGAYLKTRLGRRIRDSRYWRDADWCRGSADLYVVLSATKRFIRTDIPELLDLPEDSTLHTELPLAGSQSLTLLVTVGDRRVVLRVYPLVNHSIAKAHLAGATLLASHSVNVPQVIFSAVDAPKYGVYFILEDFIEGASLVAGDLTPRHISAMALQLARMHNVKNENWGRVTVERLEPFFPPLYQRVCRDLAILNRREILSASEVDRVRQWTSQWEPHFASCHEFSLTHNDLQPANAVFTADGDYFLIDLNRLQWGPAAREIVRCYQRQLQNIPELVNAFNDEYYAHLSPEDAVVTRRQCEFYEVFNRISSLVKGSAKAEKRPELRENQLAREKQLREELLTRVAGPAK